MKDNATYTTRAAIGAVLEYYKMKDLGAKVAEVLAKAGHELSLSDTKNDGFMYRYKRDCNVKDAEIVEAFAKAVRKMVKESTADIESYINDTYEIEYDSDEVSADSVESLLEIRRSGRMLYLELDM